MTASSAAYKRAKSHQSNQKKSFIREWGPLILFIVVVFLSRIFLWGTVAVDGPSMDPSLANNQRLIIAKVGGFSRGDIVVAKESLEQAKKNNSTEAKTIVKRVIGLPGDVLVFDHDTLTINGKAYSQPWLKKYKDLFDSKKLGALYKKSLVLSGIKGTELQSQRIAFANIADTSAAFTFDKNYSPSFTVTVPDGQYFLMGDNRVVSADSRTVGSFSKSQIQGKVLFRFWPLTKLGAP
ncbi:MAG: signal peptidase I [Streptococcaceae bacterium]|jgi:signal peptidase I|nr:signal peptidase I [Streptococcaceae bacterium]